MISGIVISLCFCTAWFQHESASFRRQRQTFDDFCIVELWNSFMFSCFSELWLGSLTFIFQINLCEFGYVYVKFS